MVGFESHLFRGRENHTTLIATANLHVHDIVPGGERLEVVDSARHAVVIVGEAMLRETPAHHQRAQRQLRRTRSHRSEPVAEIEDAQYGVNMKSVSSIRRSRR